MAQDYIEELRLEHERSNQARTLAKWNLIIGGVTLVTGIFGLAGTYGAEEGIVIMLLFNTAVFYDHRQKISAIVEAENNSRNRAEPPPQTASTKPLDQTADTASNADQQQRMSLLLRRREAMQVLSRPDLPQEIRDKYKSVADKAEAALSLQDAMLRKRQGHKKNE